MKTLSSFHLLSLSSCYHRVILPGSRAGSLLRLLSLLVLVNSATCAHASSNEPAEPTTLRGARSPLLDRPSLQLGEVYGADAVVVPGPPGTAGRGVDATSITLRTLLTSWRSGRRPQVSKSNVERVFGTDSSDRPYVTTALSGQNNASYILAVPPSVRNLRGKQVVEVPGTQLAGHSPSPGEVDEHIQPSSFRGHVHSMSHGTPNGSGTLARLLVMSKGIITCMVLAFLCNMVPAQGQGIAAGLATLSTMGT